MHPDAEVLAALAAGETITPAEATHITNCADCGSALADLRRTLDLARSSAQVELDQPSEAVWEAILAATSTTPVSTPDDRSARRRRPQVRWLIAAAAAGVALGVAGAQVLNTVRTPSPAVHATAQLQTLDTARPGGEAELLDKPDGLTLRLQIQPLEAGTGYLEVWLINTDLTRMVSIGVLPGNATTTTSFPVTPALIEQGYRIVDISREPFDNQPAHSGDSLLRGTLA